VFYLDDVKHLRDEGSRNGLRNDVAS